MITDSEVLTAVRESFAGARPSIPLDATIRRGRKIRARRRVGGLACAIVIAAGLTTVGLFSSGAVQRAPSASHAPRPQLAAWTVTKGPGNTVTVLVRQLRDPAGLQRILRADGVPVTVAFQGGVLSDTPPLPRVCKPVRLSDKANAQLQGRILGNSLFSGRPVALTLHTAEIPKGIGLNLTVQWGQSGYGWSLGLVQTSPRCTGS